MAVRSAQGLFAMGEDRARTGSDDGSDDVSHVAERSVGCTSMGGGAGIILVAPLLIPFSRVVWLAVDVLVRPVVSEEMTDSREDDGTVAQNA